MKKIVLVGLFFMFMHHVARPAVRTKRYRSRTTWWFNKFAGRDPSWTDFHRGCPLGRLSVTDMGTTRPAKYTVPTKPRCLTLVG